MPTDQFVIEHGEDRLVAYRSETAVRRFCGQCGSTLTFAGDRWPGEVHVVMANLDGPADREPQAHCYYDRKVDWATPADDLPKLGGDNGNTPLPT